MDDVLRAIKRLERQVAEMRKQLAAMSEEREQPVQGIGLKEFCSITGYTESTVYTLCSKRELDHWKQGKFLRFDPAVALAISRGETKRQQ